MRIAAWLAAALTAVAVSAHAETVDLTGYQQPDGSISASYKANFVDPYFATKALLIADDGGLKIDKPARMWINWAIKRQREDGLFDRYKRNDRGGWDRFEVTDADDAALALWLELLYRAAPEGDLPQAWKASAIKTQSQLDALLDAKQGIYYISKATPVGLLMDNAEIYASYMHIAEALKDDERDDEAKLYADKASALREHIMQVFGHQKNNMFLITTQTRDENAFYPDKVAQLYPVLYGLQEDGEGKEVYQKWMAKNGKEWLAQRNNDFPWGLVAVLAVNMNDIYSAACWQNQAEPMRYSSHWNILEEVARQDVKARMHYKQDATHIPCVGGNLS